VVEVTVPLARVLAGTGERETAPAAAAGALVPSAA